MRVMDLSGRRPPLGVSIMALPSAEMVTSLYVYLTMQSDAVAVGKEWFDEIRAAISPDLGAELAAYRLGLPEGWMFLPPWQGASPAESTCELFLTRLKSADPLALRFALLDPHKHEDRFPGQAALIGRAASGDLSAVEEYVRSAADCEEDVPLDDLRARLVVSPEEDKRRLIHLLTGWYEQVFRPREVAVTEILERDAAAKRRLALRHTPLRQIELVTNGLQYAPEPGITRAILIPSVACRPWVMIGSHRETKIFTYAVAEESMSDSASSSSTQLLTLVKALADERRLQALQVLAEREASLQELADALGVGKSLMHHHMVILRAAGLVRVRMGGDRHYQLRKETLASIPDLLQTVLAARGASSSISS
jgi:DNA-binding transcriptional ArsR family regulator